VLADWQEDLRVLLQADERRQDVLHAGEEDDHDLLLQAGLRHGHNEINGRLIRGASLESPGRNKISPCIAPSQCW
jgi:hypothetical protein